MNDERTKFITLFRTGQLIYLDWVAGELEAAGVPFQRREETSGGISLAMSITPTVGPGNWWSILVPESSLQQAQEILAAIPIEPTTEPDVWSFQPKPRVKIAWQIYAWIVLGGTLCWWIISTVFFFKNWK